ncbi:3-hydroxyacyl-CoA dehydrogenase [Hyaloraphidium curvatum]|nr:3-hydroxyacyl-CoA dehydrogenase [Hyaloraphidium curvatum]
MSVASAYPDPKEAAAYIKKALEETWVMPGIPKDIAMPRIEKVGILGAGTMGGGIAMNFANVGIPCVIVEVNAEALKRGMTVIQKNYENTAKKGRMTADDVVKRMSLLSGSMEYEKLSECDLIIEAIFENLAVKKQVFAKLAQVAKPSAILATNTSALDIDEIAKAVPADRRKSVIGLHFFSPANVMQLLEVVQAEKTSPEVVAASMAISKKIGKVAALAGVCHGFIGNRILYQRQREGHRLVVQEGIMPWEVDKVLMGFGMPMGPFGMADLVGLDIGWDKATSAGRTVTERLCELDRRGQKTGAGYYDYTADRRPVPSKVTEELITKFRAEKGFSGSAKLSEAEILEQLLFPMINEAAEILEEGKALRASDIDVVWLLGYGFPRAKGGLTFLADRIGLPYVLKRMNDFRAKYGDDFRPSPLLERLVKEGKKFADLPARNSINTFKFENRVQSMI